MPAPSRAPGTTGRRGDFLRGGGKRGGRPGKAVRRAAVAAPAGRGMLGGMADVTRLLDAAAAGDPRAAAELLPLVYDELRQAGGRPAGRREPGPHPPAPRPWSTRRTSGSSGRPAAATGTAAGTSSRPPPRPCAASWSTAPAASGRLKRGGGRPAGRPGRPPAAAADARPTTCSPWTRRSTGWPPRTRQGPSWSKLRYFAGLTGRAGGRRPGHLPGHRRPALGVRPGLAADRHVGGA